ncbi:hypothetical protein [Candidatus Pantoea carbekii]|nr:hypothetical protein [Candidatus Pantoea carbekii]
MAFQKRNTQINNIPSINKEEISACYRLNRRGRELKVRKISNDSKVNMIDLKRRLIYSPT